jgi:hypothetical protein
MFEEADHARSAPLIFQTGVKRADTGGCVAEIDKYFLKAAENQAASPRTTAGLGISP